MIERLIVRLIGDGSSYQRMMKDAMNISRQFGMAITSIGRSVTRLGRNLTLFLTAPILALGVASLTASLRMETMLIRLQALVGSAKKGAEQFEKIKKFSIPSPFLLQDLLNVNNRLVGFGMSADEAFGSMKMLADIAALTTNDFNRLALAFGQAFADQRVMARDINQFVNSSVPLLKLLEDTLGLTGKEIREMSSRGELSFELLENAIISATSVGGLFFRGTAILAETTGGKLAQFADRVFLVKASFGDLLKEGFIPILDKALELSEKMENLDKGFRRQIISALKLAAVLGPLVIVLGAGVIFLGQSITIVSILSKGLFGLAAAATAALGPYGALAAIVIGGTAAAGVATTVAKKGGEKKGFGGFLDSIDLILEQFITVVRIVARVFGVAMGAIFRELTIDFAKNLVLAIATTVPALFNISKFVVEKTLSLITGSKGPSLIEFMKVITQQAGDIGVGLFSGVEGLPEATKRIIKEETALALIRRGSNTPGNVTPFSERTRINFQPIPQGFPELMSPVPRGPTAAEFLGGVGNAALEEATSVVKDARDLLEEFLPLILEKTGVTIENADIQ